MKSEDIQALLDAMKKESDGWYGSAQEAITYLRQQVATLTTINKRLKEMIGLDCGDTACLYAVELTGMRTNAGCRCTPQPIQQLTAERDASHELNRLNGIALTELNEQLTKAEQERDALKKTIKSFDGGEIIPQAVEIVRRKHELAQARQRLSDQTDYSIKLARLIENIQYPNIDPPYEELHHYQMIKDAKQQLAEAQQREARLRGALSNLLAENEEYIKINHLLAMGNTDLVAAREALRETQP